MQSGVRSEDTLMTITWSNPRSSLACAQSRRAVGSDPIAWCGKLTPTCMAPPGLNDAQNRGLEKARARISWPFPEDRAMPTTFQTDTVQWEHASDPYRLHIHGRWLGLTREMLAPSPAL